MKDENEVDIKMRYRCSSCRNLESHHKSNKKRKCKKCGESLKEISEKDYQHYKHKLKKEYEEDKKETSKKNNDKEKKKHSDKNEEESEKDTVKHKHKLKKNLSTKNLEDKNYKIKNENEINITNKSKKDGEKKKDKKKKNRHNSMDKIGPVVSNVVNNLFDQDKLEQALDQLDELDLSDLEGGTIIVNHDINNNTKVIINNKEVSTDIFDPIFNSFGAIFNDDFANNFLQNFSSSNGNYYEEVQNIVNDNEQYGIENNVKPVQEDVLSKLKKFKLTKKYCKKDKKGKLELPNCCICLSEVELGKEAMLLPCGHLFHYKCSLNWLKNNNTCPMCRFEIK
jgi:hypothetical protein